MNRMKNRLRFSILGVIAVLMLLGWTEVQAQSVNGTLAGSVTDSTGALIPGAKLSIVNAETGAKYTGATTSVGAYRFEDVALGSYTVTASSPGFKTSVTSNVLVQIGTVTALKITLQTGEVSEQVTVSSEGAGLETQSSEVGGVVSERQVTELPLALGGVGALRADEAFVFLEPATTGPGTANNESNGVYLSKLGGGQDYGNETLLDGITQERSENGSSFDEEGPSVESLQEFKVITSLPEAEFGPTTGGVEDFVTKNGTNSFHGGGYELYKDQALDANTYFNKGWRAFYCTGANNTAACRAPYVNQSDHKNDYGATLGGPIRIPKFYNGRDKSFFFFAWEQIHYAPGGDVTSTVPTVAERGGDFTDRLTSTVVGTNPCDGSPIYNEELFDPTTTRTISVPGGGTTECRTSFLSETGKNAIPSGSFSQVAQALLPYWPQPTNDSLTNNYTLKSVTPITDTTYTIRIDHNFSEKLKMWGVYDTRDNDLFTGPLAQLPAPVSPTGWWQNFTTHFFRTGIDYSLTPNVLDYLVFGVNRSNSQNYSEAVVAGKDWSSALGYGNIANSKNFPQVWTSGEYDQLGNDLQNDDNIDNGFQLNDALVWTRGRHTLKFGADVHMQQFSPVNGNSPWLTLSPGQTAGALSQGGGDPLASLLLGEVDQAGQQVIAHTPRWTSWYYAFFAQDDFRITPTLTLNIGLRYDLDLPRKEANNDTSDFSPTAIDTAYDIPGALVFGSNCESCNTRWANTWLKDWAPRLGFAWSPAALHEKTVIRGGAGIMYGSLVYDDFGGSMVTGYTVDPTPTSANGFDPEFQIDNGFPAYAPPPNLNPGFYNGGPVSGSWIRPQSGRPATVYQWNLDVQHQLANDLTLTVGYVGNHSTDLESNLLNPNNMPISDFSMGDALYDPFVGNSEGIAAPFPQFVQNWGGNPALQSALRPFPQYDYIDAGCCLENVGMSSFDALVASVSRHYHQGLNLQVSYTYGKTVTDADSALPNSGPPGLAQDENTNNLHMDKAISAQDVRHTLVISGLYDLPMGKGKPFFNQGIAATILGGWTLGTVQRIQSGQPVSFGCAGGIPGYENCIQFSSSPGYLHTTTSMKSAVYKRGAKHINPFFAGTANGAINPNTNTMFNLEYSNTQNPNAAGYGAPAYFVDQNNNYARDCTTVTQSDCMGGLDQPYAFGVGIPRVTSQIRTPPYFNNDLSVIKKIPLHEDYALSIKAEFLNTFNEHTFSLPDSEPYDTNTFGVPSGTINAARNVQLTARFSF